MEDSPTGEPGVNDVLGVELGYTNFGKINVAGADTEAWAGTLNITASISRRL